MSLLKNARVFFFRTQNIELRNYTSLRLRNSTGYVSVSDIYFGDKSGNRIFPETYGIFPETYGPTIGKKKS